jgi:arabinan endo-1,5-alpha-L-arabinosidase
MQTLADIRIRDPFILWVPEEGSYYLFGTTDANVWGGPGEGFDCYRSTDLRGWSTAIPAFRPPSDFWGTNQFWAPEVHRWRDRYVMLATFAGTDGTGALTRGTQALVSEHPSGPYRPLGHGPLTPPTWLCLDGTLHVDDAGTPWLVFCREWLEVRDGQMLAQRLNPDLSRTEGDPTLLFHASQAPWVAPMDTPLGEAYVTDGPWLRRLSDGTLALLWSSRSAHGYAVGTAYSQTGHVLGPWEHASEPLWDHDGGHAMTFDGPNGIHLVLHRPNEEPHERAEIHRLIERPQPLGNPSVTLELTQPADDDETRGAEVVPSGAVE